MAQANPFGTLLEESRDLFRDRLGEAVAAMLAGAEAALSEKAEKAEDEEERKKYRGAIDFVLGHREAIEAQFRRKYESEFQKRVNKARHIEASLADFSLDDLALVAEDDLEETLRFNEMAAQVRRHCDEPLGAIDQRVRVLLGDANLEADDNPFGPQVICDAYRSACKQGDSTVEQRILLVKLLDAPVLDAIRGGYEQVNALFVEHGILPKIKFAVSKNVDGKPSAEDDGEE